LRLGDKDLERGGGGALQEVLERERKSLPDIEYRNRAPAHRRKEKMRRGRGLLDVSERERTREGQSEIAKKNNLKGRRKTICDQLEPRKKGKGQ